MLGKSLTGKSSIIFRYINDKFQEDHDCTIEDIYKTVINVEGIDCNLSILDTAGQFEYQSMMDSWIKYANAYILVYSIDDKDSFLHIKNIISKLKDNNKQNLPILIIGNKVDLEDERVVEYKSVKELADKHNADFFESSALDKVNIKEAIYSVVSRVINEKLYSTNTSVRSKNHKLSNLSNSITATDTSKFSLYSRGDDKKGNNININNRDRRKSKNVKEHTKENKCFCF